MFTKMITLTVICGDYCVNAFDLRQERLEKYIYSFEKKYRPSIEENFNGDLEIEIECNEEDFEVYYWILEGWKEEDFPDSIYMIQGCETIETALMYYHLVNHKKNYLINVKNIGETTEENRIFQRFVYRYEEITNNVKEEVSELSTTQLQYQKNLDKIKKILMRSQTF